MTAEEVWLAAYCAAITRDDTTREGAGKLAAMAVDDFRAWAVSHGYRSASTSSVPKLTQGTLVAFRLEPR